MADFLLKRGDTAPAIERTLKDAVGEAVNLTGATVRFVMRSSRTGEGKVAADAEVVDAATGQVRYEWDEEDTDSADVFYGEWEVLFDGGGLETFPNDGHEVIRVTEDLEGEGQPYSLVSLKDFSLRLEGGIPADSTDRAQAALDDASALIRAEAGKTWAEEGDIVPAVIKTVCISVAKRAYVNPDDVDTESLDNRSTRYRPVELTPAERKLVRQSAGKSGLWTQSTTRTEDDIPDLPSVSPTPGLEDAPADETDPFAAGWA